MHGEMEVIFSLAGRIHVLLRREINRIVDVEWMCINAAYAEEVIKLARSVESEELHKLADRVEEVHPQLHRHESIAVIPLLQTESKYVATLR